MNPLHLENVTLTYPDGVGRVVALDDVSLSVAAGEIVAVVGPSGSGKSSLLAVAGGLIPPDSGRVVVGGVELTGLKPGALTSVRRDHIGFVFQQPNLIDSLTALEQLVVVDHIAGRKPRAAESRARELLDAVGVADVASRHPGQLSGGQRQRVNIARALMGTPQVLLIDEPTSALDHEKGAEVMSLLRRLTIEREVATVLVTHDVEQLREDDRVVECRDGRVSPRMTQELRTHAALG